MPDMPPRPAIAGTPMLGIVDWGIGGIGLLQRLDDLAPALPIVCWSDAGWRPYGLASAHELVARLETVVVELADRGCTEVVLACNAASTVVDRLRDAVLPVTGIIEAGVAAVGPATTGIVGVVGGRRTIRSGAYRRALAAPDREVRSRVAQPLSAHIEAGRTATLEFDADLARVVAPLRGAATVVLACTHYPAAATAFAAALPGTVLVDPATHLARTIANRHGRPAGRPPGQGGRTYLTTGDPDAMRQAAARAWTHAIADIGVAPL